MRCRGAAEDRGCRGKLGVKEALYRLDRRGLAGNGALGHRAAHRAERDHLLLRLDPLGDHRQREIASDDEDRLEQPAAVVLVL